MRLTKSEIDLIRVFLEEYKRSNPGHTVTHMVIDNILSKLVVPKS